MPQYEVSVTRTFVVNAKNKTEAIGEAESLLVEALESSIFGYPDVFEFKPKKIFD
jgi:hypothetical protein